MSLRADFGSPLGAAASRKRTLLKQSAPKVNKVVKVSQISKKHTPSSYLAEMRLTTGEKLAQTQEMHPPRIVELLDIAETSHQKDTALDVDQALFQPFPSDITFQQFAPHQSYELPLTLRNNDMVARHIKVTHEESPYFTVVCQKPLVSKVAPGMEATYNIVFTPDEKKDYNHQLVCVTEREKFVIPVRAIGARALLDFPDEVNFSAAPVKYSSTKTVLVRNVGNREAKFKLETQHPFRVSPSGATLGVDECMQISVDFVPQRVGDHSGELAIHYDSGEDVYTQLYGSAIDVNVRLDRSSILLENTFIGLSSQRSVTIHNRSDVVVHYQWKAFASQSEEHMQRELRSQQLANEEAISREAFFERCMHNPSMRDRLPILTRSLDMNRKKYLDDERFLYSDDVISIDPVEGDIWPNSQTEVAIVFQPDGASSCSRVAYCDVTGRESRLPLKMRGEGVGPRLQFSFDTLDIQNVFVNSAHAYEVVLENKGDIEAAYSLVPPDSLFGPKFTFAPSSGVLRSGGLQAMQISFCSPVLGEFSEEFQWRVEGAPEPLRLRIKGMVIGPTFQFDVPQIKLGSISYGFLSTCDVVLSNTSEIPMTYRLRVPGEGPSPPPPPTPTPGSGKAQRNKEFEIKPRAGTLPPNFHQTIRINFVPASVKTYSTALVVDVDEAGKEVFSLPISAKSVVSPITLLTPLLDFGRCFIQHPYVQNVELLNDSNLPVKYEMSPQVDQRALVYLTPHPKGVIQPRSTLQIPLEVRTQVQGELTTAAVFNVLGSTEPPLEVGICCIGEGPVINVTPAQLNWGVCPVLAPISKTITLSNESLISAEFECALAREKTIFTVDPISAVIPPNHQLELIVTALIDDCIKFSDKLTIVVSHGVSFTVSLSAEGKGTTVVSHPPLQPRVELGAHFSRAACRWKCTLTNRGRRVQALSWTTEGFSALKLKKAEIEKNSRDTRDMGIKKQAQKTVEVKKPLFQIIPDKFVLEPYQTQSIMLEGFSPVPQRVNERMICHAIIGKNPHKERIMTVDVTAEFIAPLVEFSSRELSFTIYQPPGSLLTQHTQELEVHNVSPLPLTTVLLCGYPFSLISRGQALPQVEVQLNPSEKSAVTVQYDSTYCADRHTRIEEHPLAVAYKEHPHRDSIALKSEVHFPNVQFETTEVDFGCILNDTETIHYMTMTNSSPLEVRYAWSFLRRPPVQRVDPEQHDEGVDMQSECESNSLEDDEEEESEEDSGEEDGEGGVEEGLNVQEDAESEAVVSAAGSPLPSTTPQDEHQMPGASPKYTTSIPVTPVVETAALGELQVGTNRTPPEHPGTPVADGTPSVEAEVQEVLESGLPAGDSVASHEGSGSECGRESGSHLREEDVGSGSGRGARKSKKEKKAPPQPWELVTDPFTPISIEQVFDILPLHGLLLPGQSQQVQLTFYGHAGIATEVMALCRVEGGPTYQLRLSGEASGVEYRFSSRHIDLGKKLYNQVQSSAVVLYNSGKVDLEFCAMGVITDGNKQLAPGQVSVSPAAGYIPALENQEIAIRYLAGTPVQFNQTFHIQVAHFEPDAIALVGEGIFPQISFNLPREMTRIGSELYTSVRTRALGRMGLGGAAVDGAKTEAATVMDAAQTPESEFEVTVAVPPSDLECEMEKVLVGDFALEHAEDLASARRQQGSRARGPRPTLPEFYLDFGYVVYGQVVSRLVTLKNTGHCPVSFTTAHTALEGTGFSVDLGDRVRSLPGAPDFERLEFSVRFDPAAVRSPEGHAEALLPFSLIGGPTYPIRLSSEVVRPGMELSCSQLNFGTVVCGQCKIITVRLHNPLHVKCEWTAITDKPPKKIPKHIPLHIRRKMKEKPPPKYFEVDPPSGILLPEQRTDIRLRFMPSEELHYSEKIPFVIRQNAENDLAVHVEGWGSEPHIQFDRSLVEFSPVLPFSPGSEGEVTISNPKPYPIEVYSLSFDGQYLEEEETLRWLKEYDKQKRLVLPPRNAGDKLPQEVLEAFGREQKQQRASDRSLQTTGSEAQVADSAVSVDHAKTMAATSSTEVLPQQVGVYELKTPLPSTLALVSVPELSVIESISALTNVTIASHPDLQATDLSPVAAAIARYLGLNLSPAATLAENRRGVAIMVHGPLSSGRSTQAKALGEKYSAAVLVVDDILTDAISSASTPAGCKAREICIQAAQARAEVFEAVSSLSAPSKKQVSKELGSKDKEKEKEKEKESQPEPPPANPEPPCPFSVQPLKETQFAVPEGSLLPAPLPEDLIVEILSDRLQHTDCRRGAVVDGIESHFTSSPVVSAALILRAFHNRKHISFVNIHMEVEDIGQRKIEIEKEREQREAEEALEKQRAEEKEKERIAALLDLAEDEYEALSEERREEIDQKRLEIWREKQRQKRREKEERELLEREREEEERRLEEERRGQRKGKLKDAKTTKINAIKPPAVAALSESAGQVPSTAKPSRPPSQATGAMMSSQVLGGMGPTASGASIMSGVESMVGKRRGTRKMSAKISTLAEENKQSPLMKQYCYYKAYEEDIKTLLEDWDRVRGDVRPKPPPEPEEPQPPPTKAATPSRKSKGKVKENAQEVEKVEEKAAPVEESREGVGVPLVGVEGVQSVGDVTRDIMAGLPSVDEILEGMGLGPKGPPIPAPVTLQVYPYPLKRRRLDSTANERFVFIAASPSDPNAPQEEPKAPEPPTPEEPPPPSRMSKRTGSVRSMESSDSGSHRRSPHKQPSSTKRKTSQSSMKTVSPVPQQQAVPEDRASSEVEIAPKPQSHVKLVRFRWVIPAGGQAKLRLLFSSQDEGQFDQTLGFEIVGTRRRYQLFCRGICVVPTICREPRIVFPCRKKSRGKDEIVSKRFVLDKRENAFVFGPLHCGKTRERYREGRYPENMETLTISNTCSMETKVAFCFQYDHNATTWLLDPPAMTLQPGESKNLTVWAYPKSANSFEDALVCCIQHNPNPVVFKMNCEGVEPKLEVDTKQLDFKKVLLHKKHSKVLHLQNNTLLPVAWRLSGLDQLGEDFSFSQDHGIVQPKTVFPLNISFRAFKQVAYKKAFRIEISDVEQIMGLMHVETVQIQAEAYDVAMDISFPRGTDKGLDFQCIRVADEQKLVMQLRNKGKYDIGFSFLFAEEQDYSRQFRVQPSHSTLYPGEKSQAVSVTFKSNKEFAIKDKRVVICQVLDNHQGKDGDVIAEIPILISARAVFSKFAISPINDINFGSMTVGARKSNTFTLENKGEFEFKYTIVKKPTAAEQQKQRAVSMAAAAAKARTKSREGRDGALTSSRSSLAGKPGGSKGRGETSLRTEVIGGVQRLVLGVFMMNPAQGSILAGQSQTITVECTADKQGTYSEELSIEITDRQKDDPPVTYKLCGEFLTPAINITDMASVFEEHRVCKQLGVLGQHQFHEDGCVGVYAEKERKFVFKSVVVGRTSKARFKISNPNKISCDVQLKVSSQSAKESQKQKLPSEFEVEPGSKVAIPSHSHVYATVSFRPTAMQSYSATFEAIPDVGTKTGKGLSFEICGEGNLPQVAILKPSLTNAKGHRLLLFRRLLLSQSQSLAVTLQNTGTIPATVVIETVSGHRSFSIQPPVPAEDEELELLDNRASSGEAVEPHESAESVPIAKREGKHSSGPPPVPLRLHVNETKEFVVTFQPHVAKKCRGELRLRIRDNQFENLPLQLVGEGYEDEVCIENIRGQLAELPPEAEKERLEEDVEASWENHLYFGGCPVGQSRQATFTLTNHSSRMAVRFNWSSSPPELSFSPALGHLHPCSSKDITVTFKADKTLSFEKAAVSGKLQKITFSQPISQIPDWDDRMKSVRWVNVPQSQLSAVPEGGEEGVEPPRPPTAPAKKKVIETEQEPCYSEVGSGWELELFASALAGHAHYECPTTELKFRDTLMYQTRAHSFPVKNSGEIALSYRWTTPGSATLPPEPHSPELHLNETGSIVSEGGELMPFTITPLQGVIPPGEEASFTLRFSPLDVMDAESKFICHIPHLHSELPPLELTLYGRSLMPYCHFELEHSDYLTQRRAGDGSGQGGSAFGSSLDPSSTRVIEFHSCGIGVKITKRFQMINPTSTGYEFNWTNEGGSSSPFKCLTPKGFVAGGRKYELAFEYLPSVPEVTESFWRFSIPSFSLSHSFLLVGHTVEPAVNLDRAYVSFKAMRIGSRMKETVYLLNDEGTAYHFTFLEKSCHSDGHSAKLVVSPMDGVIPPHSKLPIEVSFAATQEREHNFNLQCSVHRKPTPLLLNVKAEGYVINVGLAYTTPKGKEVQLPTERGAKRIIDFGQVPVRERALGRLSVLNHSHYNLEYRWKLSISEKCQQLEEKGEPLVIMDPMEGVVEPHSRLCCELAFSPPSKMTLKGCELTLEITNGSPLSITLRGSGVEPQVSFSSTDYDFGPCFLHRADMSTKKTTIIITNNDGKDISVNCLYTEQPHLQVQFEPILLSPGEDTQAVVEFRPRDTVRYRELVAFEINGLSKKVLTVHGEGVLMKVELANPSQKVVNFGALRIDDRITKTMRLLNHSPVPVPFCVSIVPSSSSPALQKEGVLTANPSRKVILPPNGGGLPISITFHPKERVPQFSEEVTLECAGLSQPLLVVAGCCQGLDISLDSKHLPFGAVVQHSRSSRRVLMINSGDIGARFNWEADKFAPDFSITPIEGYISPGMEIPFDLTFHPSRLNHDIRYDHLPCHVEGRNAPLTLTLTGGCIEQTPNKEVVSFTTVVRSRETRDLTIQNKTNSPWLLRPSIDGEYWSGPETLAIGPMQTGHYQLTYHPLAMTAETQKHQGSIFFPIPDGSGQLFNLLGISEPPKSAGSITREIPCKTSHTELLPIENWLRRSQRFRVTIEPIRPEKLDRSVSLHGLDYLDVPAMSRRDYRLNFFSFKEGSVFAKVTFTNRAKEYVFYNVLFKSASPGIIDTVELATPVRQSKSHTITITNPLLPPVSVSTSSTIADITVPYQFTVGGQSKGTCTFEYLPLKVGETTGKLTLQSSDLGTYQYELHLVATPAPPERAVHFTTMLGSGQQQPCRFTSYSKGRTEYACKVDSSDFHVDSKTITVASAGSSGQEAAVDVTFEPSHLGDTQGTLSISSPSGGDYTIPLYGHCLVPKPQGPFVIRAGTSISIPFKNVFAQAMQFSFSIDNPVFTMKVPDNLKPRKTYNISVSYMLDKQAEPPKVAKMGKMVVTSHQATAKSGVGVHGGISWVYYLKGVPHPHL